MHPFKLRCFLIVSILVLFVAQLPGQQRVDPQLMYERLVCIVPMIGTGTYEDPRRPAYVPDHLLQQGLNKREESQAGGSSDPFLLARAKQEPPQAITGFTYELSDDEQFALVEFQATSRAAFQEILRAAEKPGASQEVGANRNALDGGYDVKAFVVGKALPEEIEKELGKHKQGFRLHRLGGRLP